MGLVRPTPATSDALGTTLPRYGFFLGVRPPRHLTTVIDGELPSTSSDSETAIPALIKPKHCHSTQTSPVTQYDIPLLPETLIHADIPGFHNTDATYAFICGESNQTDSLWQELRRTLAPLRVASDALLEDIKDALDHQRRTSARARHAGLTAVARLVDVLGLTRPTVLRMGRVPESTFYAWQKNPQALIRTPTVVRLLQLQAQVAILDELLGREHMRAWILSPERLAKLQGDESAFTEVLAEVKEAFAETARIKPRPRVRREEYITGTDSRSNDLPSESSKWPGAAKIPEEEDKNGQ